MDQKMAIPPEELCKELPNELLSLLIYARIVEFEEQPCYNEIKNMFITFMNKNNLAIDNVFDWDILETSSSEDINNIKKINNK